LSDNSISETERRSLARNQSLPPSNVTDENQSDAETRRLARQAI
jgi:hypothetical protein